MTGPRLSTAIALCAALGIGCAPAGSYVPQDRERIYFVRTSAGGPVLERGGKRYGTNPLWGDLESAVSGDAVAEAHARKYVRQTWYAGGLALVALGCFVPTGLLLDGGSDSTGTKVAAVGLGVGGMTSLMLALLMPLVSRHHLYDAVNVYNDNLAQRRAGAGAPTEPRLAP